MIFDNNVCLLPKLYKLNLLTHVVGRRWTANGVYR